MTVYGYIQLVGSSGSPASKFKVVDGGYRVTLAKAQTENETIGGIDVAMGAIHETHEYMVKVRESRWTVVSSGSYRKEEDDIGILSDLQYFYELNNPAGSPNTNVVTLIDHYGSSKSVFFVGELAKTPVTIIIEGGEAMFYIPIRLRVIPS